jgi:hypothetical protein
MPLAESRSRGVFPRSMRSVASVAWASRVWSVEERSVDPTRRSVGLSAAARPAVVRSPDGS